MTWLYPASALVMLLLPVPRWLSLPFLGEQCQKPWLCPTGELENMLQPQLEKEYFLVL